MEEFKPTKIDLSTINNGKGKYNNGDGIQADIINSVIEASAWAQSLGTNQPNIENIDNSYKNNEFDLLKLNFENELETQEKLFENNQISAFGFIGGHSALLFFP